MNLTGRILICAFCSICPFFFINELDDSKEKIIRERKIENIGINIYDLPQDYFLICLSFAFCFISLIFTNNFLNFINRVVFKNPKCTETKLQIKMVKNVISKFLMKDSNFSTNKKFLITVKKVMFMNRFVKILKIQGVMQEKIISHANNFHNIILPTFSSPERSVIERERAFSYEKLYESSLVIKSNNNYESVLADSPPIDQSKFRSINSTIFLIFI
jgi:hypothetical protein